VVSKAKDRAESPSCRALGLEKAQVLNIERRQKLGVHHGVPLLATASQARHAPRMRLMLTRIGSCRTMNAAIDRR
jgi:hypothetical protein